jgi:acetolactate synthase-1/2/3 large subunit
MTKMSGAKALLESLEHHNVEVIFGILGGAILPVYDALCGNKKIRHILARHEQCAAHEAEGYARASGRAGVCMATSGPGATNLVTGIANAYMDSSPVIALTGQIPSSAVNSSYMIGRDAFQEADIIGITSAITKYNYQPRSVSEIPGMVNNAFYIATTGRPGPVLIDLPKNIQSGMADVEFTNKIDVKGYKLTTQPDPTKISEAADLLAKAERPILLVGGGAITAEASDEVVQMSDLLMAPVATTFMGKGAFPENHPLSLGSIGMHGNPAANKLMGEADVMLAIGTRFSDRATANLDTFAPGAKKIQIDIDNAEINKNIEVDLPIVADAKIALKMLHSATSKKLQRGEGKAWTKRVKETKEQLSPLLKELPRDLVPKTLLFELRKLLPENAIVTTEVGQNQMWSALYFQALKPRTFISSGGLGTMGFGFPAAIGRGHSGRR